MKNINTVLSKLTSIEDDRYISLKDCLVNKDLEKYQIPICFGRDTNGKIVVKDFIDIGNLLMSGFTSSGKSVFINSFINTILLTKEPEKVKLILIEPKQIELPQYNGIEHLLYPVCSDMQKASLLLDWCIEEISRRKTESIKRPYIIVVIDEFSDLMLCEYRTNHQLEQIAKEGIKVGMFMLLSASVPRSEVFTKELKNVIPTRLVGNLGTSIDSKELIDEGSAIDLLGNGDMIYKNVKSGERIRVQTPFISTDDQMLIIKGVPKTNEYKEVVLEEIEEEIDPLYEDAKRVVIEEKKVSTTLLQRRLVIGYNRASKIVDQLEKEGIITPFQVNKPREVIVGRDKSN